jgi:hypothetical protein
MKRGFILTLVTVAISLLCVSGYAYAPIINSIPDVYIGDGEDNAGTIDINLFRFSDAFNFDMYVRGDANDEDFATTQVRWSFLSLAAGELTINGISEVDVLDTIQPDLVGKELTSYPNNDPVGTTGRATSWATFYDLVDSPIASGPVWPDPTSPLDTIVTVYASNGTKADSATFMVRAIDDQFDKVSSSGPELVKHWDSPATQGWAKALSAVSDGTFINAVDGAFYISAHSTDGGSLKIQGRATSTATGNYFGSWQSPNTDIAYQAGKVFRVKYKIKTDQTDPGMVPDARLMTEFTDGSDLLVSYGNRVHKSPFSPTTAGKWYNVYVGGQNDYSPDCTNLRVKFDLINFDASEWGNLYLMECIVEKFDVPAKSAGTLIKTYDTAAQFSTWATNPNYAGLGITFFGPVTHGTSATGLSIQTDLNVTSPAIIDYGFWECVSDVYYEADTLYRAIFSLSSPDATLSKWRILARKNDGDWSSQLIADPFVYQSQMPSSTPKEYDLWYETVPEPWMPDNLDVNNKMVFAFDLQDLSNTLAGTLFLDKLELYTYDIP